MADMDTAGTESLHADGGGMHSNYASDSKLVPIKVYVFGGQETTEDAIFNPASKLSVIMGAPGTGKTTLIERILLRLASNPRVFLMSVDARNRIVEQANSIEDLITLMDIENAELSQACEALEQDCSRVVLVVDSFEALSERKRIDTFFKSLFGRILKRQVYSELKIVVATRPSGLETLYKCQSSIDTHLEILGFSASDTYKHLLHLALAIGPGNEQKIYDFVSHYPVLRSLCSNPMILELFIELYKSYDGILPETLTEVYSILVLAIVRKYRKVHSSSLDKIVGDTKKDLDTISRLALRTLLDMKNLSEIEISHFCSKECITNLTCLNGIGIFQATVVKEGDYIKSSYNFLHLSVQEFLAARAVAAMPVIDQFMLCWNHKTVITSKFKYFLPFCFGLTANDSSLPFYNPMKSILPTIIDMFSYVLDFDSSGDPKLKLFLLKCIWEAREPALWRKVALKHLDLITLSLDNAKISPLTRRTLASLIVHSGIKSWELTAPESGKHIADGLQMLVEMQTSGAIQLKITLGMELMLRPDSELAGKHARSAGRTKDAQYFSLRCLKDILHHILKLYSPVTLRSDVSNSSYLNFVSCECMQRDASVAVVIQPITPIHWIPLPPRTRKGKHDKEADAQHFTEHNMERMELVVIGCPYPEAVRFAVSGQEVFIPLCSYEEPTFSEGEGEIACTVMKLPEMLVVCYQESMPRRGNEEKVYPGLLLPPKKSDSGYNSGAGTGDTATQIVTPHPTVPVPIAQVVPQQAQGGRKPLSHQPGFVVFSSIPSVMSMNKIYPLPDETTLIRKGGNGEIFEGTYAGVTFAIKKTIFRQREYNILMKLHHRNIMPLILLMIGKPHPVHKRRVFCYQVMPHMSGDCARMITDHQHLTMKELMLKYSNDFPTLTLAQNNVRYLIREILQGLAYLHSIHVVHRDVKASNILVKMYCGCENPITCFCPTKCHIAISDFDACLQLNEFDLLQPISLSGTKTSNMFYLSPVGTQGFRSPEGSMLTVASHCEIIIPCVSPKSDIWSLGILLLHLLIGEDGPSSQRETALLILYYYQLKEMKEGKVMTPLHFLAVPQKKIQDVLRLTLLHQNLTEMTTAIHFTQQCLQVDPDDRKSAEELLSHSFLDF